MLRVLDKYQVKATFFVIGTQVVRNPALARRMVAEGHELGVHTFTHPDLAVLPGWRRELEYAQAQLAIASTTGVRTSLLRFPYSSSADAYTDRDWPMLRQAGELGYLTVVNDVDSRDWEKPAVDAMLANGLVFLDRTETVAAWLAMLAVQFVTAVVAFRLDREKLGVLWVLPLQQFVYRQLMYLVLIQSVVTALTGGRLGWQKLRRTGNLDATARRTAA